MKMKQLVCLLVLAFAFSMLFTGCVEQSGVESVTLDITEKTVKEEETFTLVASVKLSEDAADALTTVKWTSSKTSVATVDSDGLVTAVAAGSATIKAASTENSKASASCVVTVTEGYPAYKTAGEYKVGTAIEAGEYLLITDRQGDSLLNAGYVQITASAGAVVGSDDFLFNDNFYNRIYVSITDGQYIKFSSSKLYKLDSSPVIDKTAASFASGQYKVGRDIDAGEYLLITNEKGESITSIGYVEVATEPNAKILSSAFLYNGNFTNRHYVRVENGQYIKLSASKLYKLESAPAVDKNAASWEAGQYKVGSDIDAGEYLLTTTGQGGILNYGFVEITLKPYGKIGTPDYVSNSNFETTKYITLVEGQYVYFNRSVLTKG